MAENDNYTHTDTQYGFEAKLCSILHEGLYSASKKKILFNLDPNIHQPALMKSKIIEAQLHL